MTKYAYVTLTYKNLNKLLRFTVEVPNGDKKEFCVCVCVFGWVGGGSVIITDVQILKQLYFKIKKYT